MVDGACRIEGLGFRELGLRVDKGLGWFKVEGVGCGV